jgi:hypothetical protein
MTTVLPGVQVVNGYVCRNCTDVDLAKKNIDPAHPKLADGRAATPEAKKAEKETVDRKRDLATHGTIGTKLDVSA